MGYKQEVNMPEPGVKLMNALVQQLENVVGHRDMQWEDFVTSLYFFQDLDNEDGIMIQVSQVRDLPYIRRGIFLLLGEPSTISGNIFRYGRKRIVISSLSQASEVLHGYRLPAFYVRSTRMDVEQEILANQGVTIGNAYDHILSLWDLVGVSPERMISGLCYDGLSAEDAKLAVGEYISWTSLISTGRIA